MSSAPLFGRRRQEDHDAELVARRLSQLAREDRHDLGRPEELILEVDEPHGRAERAEVRLEDPEVAARESVVDAVRHRADELGANGALLGDRARLSRASGRSPRASAARCGRRRRRRAALRSVRSRHASRAASRTGCPLESSRSPGEGGQVDAADVCDTTVDHRELLVVAVHRSLAARRVPCAMRVPPTSSSRLSPDVAPRRRKSGSGAPAHASTRTSARSAASASSSRSVGPPRDEAERGLERPAGEQHRVLAAEAMSRSSCASASSPSISISSRVAVARRRVACAPEARRRAGRRRVPSRAASGGGGGVRRRAVRRLRRRHRPGGRSTRSAIGPASVSAQTAERAR